MEKELWSLSKSKIKNTHMARWMSFVRNKTGLAIQTWSELYLWSINDSDTFWELCAEYVNILWHKKSKKSFGKPATFMNNNWFLGSELNFCENLIANLDSDFTITSITETNEPIKKNLNHLKNEVANVAKFLKSQGLKKGDVVFGVLSNTYHAVVAMLATTSFGGVWSSCSPDFGLGGIRDRMKLVKPKAVFYTLDYTYNGKVVDCRANIEDVRSRFKEIPTICISLLGGEKLDNAVDYSEFELMPPDGIPVIEYESVSFYDPLYILFSSGTTGTPKGIVHGVGGTLLQHKKELLLHCDIDSKDRLFYFTTCGWMMWNWMVSALSTGASLVTYEGSPLFSNPLGLWNIVAEQNVTVFGTSPKFLSIGIKSEYDPKEEQLDFSRLRTILSTGSPLMPEHYDWVYTNIKEDLHLASISGGTDIISCFMLGNPILPVVRGEIQSPGLGMAIESWNYDGAMGFSRKGELVCTKPFISMPLCFLDDPENRKYKEAYFNHYRDKEKTVWRHGDFVSIRKISEGVIIHGRSDSTLNPGGVRIGTSEIYRYVEAVEGVEDSLAIGYELDPGEVSIILFIKTLDGMLDEGLRKKVLNTIRKNLTPRHIPAQVFGITDIPYTRSGKKVELAVRNILSGEAVLNKEALENPEVLSEYSKLAPKLANSKEKKS